MGRWRKTPFPLDFPQHPERRPALVVGASSGIGRASAVALAAQGHPVAVAARRVERLAEVVEAIEEAGGEAVAVEMDVSSDSSVAAGYAAAAEALGPIEVLVHGAGHLQMGRIWEMTAEEFGAQVDLHLVAAQRLAAVAVPPMVERRRGDFVLIGSDTAWTHRARSGAYPSAKAGVDALAHQLQYELEGTGVRASVVRPGPVATEMGTDVDEETLVAVIGDWVRFGHGRHPRMCTPEQLAAGVCSVVGLSRGAFVRELEIQPEAPID
ncbi:SDR family oxidoreductase [Dietzia sp.]|uniref:SDR family oxidoreductase n=1 Tax=Dietzia sp. TaxID=1871616 RepID=UPI002FD8E2C1